MTAVDTAIARVILSEGGYVNDPSDPGGETKYGISKRAYPNEDIANMTLTRAAEIYMRDYWSPAGCDDWPPGVAYEVFDAAVNQGVRAAITMLQRAAGAVPDGVIGADTLAHVRSCDAYTLRLRLTAQRLRAYTSTPGFDRFGKGWINRVASNLEV